MSEPKAGQKPGRPSRSIEEEIAATEERLQALRARKREQERLEREKNQKAILALIRAENLDDVPSDVWKAALAQIKSALQAQSTAETPVQPQAPQFVQQPQTDAYQQ